MASRDKKFVVVSTSSVRSMFHAGNPLFVGALLGCCALAWLPRDDDKWELLATCLVGWLVLVLVSGRFTKSAETTKELSVAIYPLGVQLETRSNGGRTHKPLFLPREAILDVIMLEMILSYKVTTVVVFRVIKMGPRNDHIEDKTDLQKLLQQDRVALIPAFPGVEMSYNECQTMWHAISKSLGTL